MDFVERINLLRDPGDTEISASIYDDLLLDYQSLTDGAAAKTGDLEATLELQRQEIGRLKAKLFDLTVGAPAQDAPPVETTDEPEGDEDDTDAQVKALAAQLRGETEDEDN